MVLADGELGDDTEYGFEEFQNKFAKGYSERPSDFGVPSFATRLPL